LINNLPEKVCPKKELPKMKRRKKFNCISRMTATLLILFAQPLLAANHTVTMKSISYEPKALQIKAGDTVDWENVSYTEHSATADDGEAFDTGMIQPKKRSKKIEFKKPGTFTYHCTMHGKSMSAHIEVSR
jgi:plastocyanin